MTSETCRPAKTKTGVQKSVLYTTASVAHFSLNPNFPSPPLLSDAVPAAPSGRLVLMDKVQQAVRRHTRAASCRLVRLLRVAQALLRVAQHFVNGCQTLF